MLLSFFCKFSLLFLTAIDSKKLLYQIQIVSNGHYIPQLNEFPESQIQEINQFGYDKISAYGTFLLFQVGQRSSQYLNVQSHIDSLGLVNTVSSSQPSSIHSANAFLKGLYYEKTGLKLENENTLYYFPPVKQTDLIDDLKDDFALPQGRVLTPIETATNQDDLMFQVDQDCEYFQSKYKSIYNTTLKNSYQIFQQLFRQIESHQINYLKMPSKITASESVKVCEDIINGVSSLDKMKDFSEMKRKCNLYLQYFYLSINGDSDYQKDYLTIFFDRLENQIQKKISINEYDKSFVIQQNPQIQLFFGPYQFTNSLLALFLPNRKNCILKEFQQDKEIEDCFSQQIQPGFDLSLRFFQEDNQIKVEAYLNDMYQVGQDLFVNLDEFLKFIKKYQNQEIIVNCRWLIERPFEQSSILGHVIILTVISIIAGILILYVLRLYQQLKLSRIQSNLTEQNLVVQIKSLQI